MKKAQNRLGTLYKRQVRMVPQMAMLIASLLILFFGSSKLTAIGWANGTMVSIDPTSQEIFPEGTATTDILIEGVGDLYGFEFQLTFDETLVEGVQVQPGNFLSPDWILGNTIDNDNGTIDYALSQMGPSEPVSGTGVLATITWRGEAVGTSPIHFTYVLLSTPGGVPIPASTQDGQIRVGGPFRIYLPIICR